MQNYVMANTCLQLFKLNILLYGINIVLVFQILFNFYLSLIFMYFKYILKEKFISGPFITM